MRKLLALALLVIVFACAIAQEYEEADFPWLMAMGLASRFLRKRKASPQSDKLKPNDWGRDELIKFNGDDYPSFRKLYNRKFKDRNAKGKRRWTKPQPVAPEDDRADFSEVGSWVEDNFPSTNVQDGVKLFKSIPEDDFEEEADVDQSSIKAEILKELNAARTNPKAYATKITNQIKQYVKYNTKNKKWILQIPGQVGLLLNEGMPAIDEAIAFLSKQAPIAALSGNAGLDKAAQYMADISAPKGTVGHTGPDGSTMQSRIEKYGKWSGGIAENIAYGSATAFDIVSQLIIDDGVASRGHRKNIFNSSLKVVGIGYTTAHKVYKHSCVMDFAGSYTAK